MGLKLILMIGFVLSLTACQTSQLKQYQQLHLGMEKHDVLEIMGSPYKTGRSNDQDRWTYIFYDNQIRNEKEVHFFEGTAVYIGEKSKPLISAEEQDRINAELERHSANQYQAVPPAKSYPSYLQSTPSVDETLEGTPKLAPKFEPVQ